MKNYSLYIVALFSIYTLSSCEKVVDVDLPQGAPLPYVDAWLTDKPGKQSIKFLRAVNYLESKQPESVTDAQINVTDLTASKTYAFAYSNGEYAYDAGAAAIGVIGHQYKLSITWNGELFEATETLNRVNKIDSITYKYKEEKNGDKAGYYAEFHAKDVPNGTDWYWIRTYKNGQLNYDVQEMVSIDGTFYEDISNGLPFIEPLTEGVTSEEKPYVKGDVVKVLIRSVSKPTYDFLNQLISQLYNGGLFAEVLQNVPANITNKQPGSKTKIYGWFGTVAETELSRTIQ
jgi:hypothetical protein